MALLRRCCRSGRGDGSGLADEFGDLLFEGSDVLFEADLALGDVVGAADEDDGDIGEADESEDLLEVAGLCVVALHVGAGCRCRRWR